MLGCDWCRLIIFSSILGSYLCTSEFNESTVDKQDAELPVNSSSISFNQDNSEQCPKGAVKFTFPDIDYALLGYNIFKGYPLNTGHDPGFTFPIFSPDYSTESKSADCRYSIPVGLVVIPDVSCSTSFSSTVIQTKFEFDYYLSASVNVRIGSFFNSFTASVGYKRSVSIVSNKENVLIMSSAQCRYYFSKLNLYSPPQFSPEFLKWIHRLDKSSDKDTYITFIDYYGTHFPVELNFGARYVYRHEMKSSQYKKETKNSVSMSASYSSWFASGRVSMSASMRKSFSEFSRKVTTSTITTGAPPPADGDALTWASTVKENPVPVKYKLETIDKLFTEQYMGKQNINFKRIAKNLRKFSSQYCSALQEQGLIDTCFRDSDVLPLESTKLSGYYTIDKTLLLTECMSNCEKLTDCSAISFCKTCKKNACRQYSKTFPLIYSTTDDSWTSVIIRYNINSMLKIHKTAIIGNNRGKRRKRAHSKLECAMRCYDDQQCIAFSYCFCPEKSTNCQLFAENSINHFHEEASAASYILPTYIRNVTREDAIKEFTGLLDEMMLESTRLSHSSASSRQNSLQLCIKFCFRTDDCTALSFSQKTKSCEIFIGSYIDGCRASHDEKYITIFLRSKFPEKYEIQDTNIFGGKHPDGVAVVDSKVNCSSKCLETPTCVAVSYSPCSDGGVKCSLYSDDNIIGFKKSVGDITVVLGGNSVTTKQLQAAERIFVDSTRLIGKHKFINHITFKACKKECRKRKECTAITYLKRHRQCYIFNDKIKMTGRNDKNWKTVFYRNKNNNLVHLTDTDIDKNCNLQNGYQTKTSSECFRICLDQSDCVAMSFSKCSYDTKNCKIFQEENIQKFKKKTRTDTYILPQSKSKSLNQIVSQNIVLKSTRLWGHSYETKVNKYHLCETECVNKLHCVAISYAHKKCQQFYGNLTAGGTQERHWKSTIFSDKIKTDLVFRGTGITPDCAYTTTADDLDTCSNQCRKVIGCVAVTYKQGGKCKMFEYDSVTKLESAITTKTVFISRL